MMRAGLRDEFRPLVPVLALAVIVLFAALPARAGEYHFGETLVCEECHARVDGLTADQHPLKGASADQVCLSCHDGKPGIPDVRGEDVNVGSGPRQAGALTTGGAGYEHWKGHTLGSSQSPPGGAWPGGETMLRCVSCHSPHGNANYRNLGGVIPNPPRITYTVSTRAANTTDVRIDLPGVPPVGARLAAGFYNATRVYYNQVSPQASPYGAFCAACHGEFHGVARTGMRSPFRRHPSEGVGMPPGYVMRYNTHTNRVSLMAANNGAMAMATRTATPSCMTCHRAHGNRNAFGLIYMKATGIITEQGVEGGRLNDLCGQCHVEAG
jgi:doubled CXXCH motif protein